METIRYSPIGKEDCNFGTGTFEVTLADGRVVLLSQIDVGALLGNALLSTQSITGLTLVNTTFTGTATFTAPAFVNATLTTPTITSGVLNTSTVGADPTAALGIASKQYVDALKNLVSHTSSTTIAQTTRTALLSGASFTLTLNSAVGNTGQQITFIHQGTSLTQVYTIDPAGSETIEDGTGPTTTYLLYTKGERLTIVSDGANWSVVEHIAMTDWVSAGTMTITGSSANPSKPSTPDIDAVYWRRLGKRVQVRYSLQISSATGGTTGTGAYLFALPTGITFDTTVITPVATNFDTAATHSETLPSMIGGVGFATIDSTSVSDCTFLMWDTSNFQVFRNANIVGGLGSTSCALNNAEMGYLFLIEADAAGWRV